MKNYIGFGNYGAGCRRNGRRFFFGYRLRKALETNKITGLRLSMYGRNDSGGDMSYNCILAVPADPSMEGVTPVRRTGIKRKQTLVSLDPELINYAGIRRSKLEVLVRGDRIEIWSNEESERYSPTPKRN